MTKSHFKFHFCRDERAVCIKVGIMLNMLCIVLSKIPVGVFAHAAKKKKKGDLHGREMNTQGKKSPGRVSKALFCLVVYHGRNSPLISKL